MEERDKKPQLKGDADEIFADRIVTRLRNVLGDGDGTESIALHEPMFAGDEWKYVKECLDTGWVSSAGKYVDAFETKIADACGAAHAVAVVNGTAALHVALLVSGVQPEDEVLVPALTFVATANAVTHAGAVPHFVDSDRGTLGISAYALQEYLQDVTELRNGHAYNTRTQRRISAVIPMHTFGHPVDMDALVNVATTYGLAIIEDAAEALGSRYRDKMCGSLGEIGAVSFNGNKIITTGGGGAILTNSAELAAKAKHLTTTAKVAHAWEFHHDEVAFNYRMPNINAALGCAQLGQLPGFLARKRRLAARYIKAFEAFEGACAMQEPSGSTSNYWLNALILDQERVGARDAVLAATNAAGLQCRPVWKLLNSLPMYEDCPRMPLPVAEILEKQLINIPSSVKLEDA